MREIIQGVAQRLGLNRRNIRGFLNESFNVVAQREGIGPSHYQKRASLTGTVFEICTELVFQTLFPQITLVPGVEIEEACMSRQGKADFVIYGNNTNGAREIVVVIEAKGSADHIVYTDGSREEFTIPGMRRTDTVKKAICNAYQISRALPEALFFIVTSHKPEEGGNAFCMCNLAEGDIVDKIVDVTNEEDLDEMVRMIEERLQ